MRKYVFILFACVVTLITYFGCGNDNGDNNNTHYYRVDYYLDTIQGHIIISAVCSSNNGDNVSVSSIEVGTADVPNRLLFP